MKKKKNNVGRIILGIVLLVLIVAGAGYFVYVYFQWEDFTVKGNSAYSAAYIEELAAISPGTHMLSLDLDEVKERIEAGEPYIEVVDIYKSFPKTVGVEVKERQPKVIMAYTDRYLLIDETSNALEILDDVSGQPYTLITGVDVTSVTLGKPVETEDTFKISVLSEIITELERRELFGMVAVVDLSDINNITFRSESGMLIKFGQADKVADKIKWIKNRLPAHERDGKIDGVLDVTSGDFITYQLGPSETQDAGTDGTATDGADDADGGTDGADGGTDGGADDTGDSGSQEPDESDPAE